MENNGNLRLVEQNDLFRLKFLQTVQLSPDGKYIAYEVVQVERGESQDEERGTLWLMNVDSGGVRQLTNGATHDSNPQWSPDGKRIAFISARNKKPQIYIIPVDGGEACALTSLKQGVGGNLAWSPDGSHIAFTAPSPVEAPDLSKPYRLTRHTYRFDKIGYLDGLVHDICIVPVTGGDPRQITHDASMNTSPQWSPDGNTILYLASMFPDSHRGYIPHVCIVNLVDGQHHDLTGNWGAVSAAAWMPDGEHIVFIGSPLGVPIGSKSDVWVTDLHGSSPECRTATLTVGVGGKLQADMPPIAWEPGTIPLSKDGSTAFVHVQVGGTVQIYRVALVGPESYEAVITGDRACYLLDADEQYLLYFVSTINNPTDLYLANVDGTGERCLLGLNDELLSQWRLPTTEHLQFTGSDGVAVEGWIVKPPVGDAPYPTILYIHGGPHGAFGHVFHFDTQMLCGAGYAVLLVNHRASTGYGDAFSTAIKGDWGNLDYGDLMAGVDHAIATGSADADRLGVCGLSGGGNLSCWVVGQTNRFKAAVPENPVTNWQSFYGVSDIGVWFSVQQLGGHPHEIPEVYARCSPINYAHRCTTPTLLIQGEHDWRCPAEQSEQFYAVLKANGCVVEMLRLPNSFHTGTITGAPINRRVHNEALLDWMDRYVVGKSAVQA